MKEIKEILLKADRLANEGRNMVLATVVHLEGSSYRRPGARMLVSDTGELTGAISGGCLEGDALEKALLVLAQQAPRIVTYDTMDDDDPLGVALGCNGVLQVLMEPVRSHDPFNPLEMLRLATSRRRPSVMATLFSLERKKGPQPGTRLVLEENGAEADLLGEGPLATAIRADASQALRAARSCFMSYQTDKEPVNAFLEYIPPPVSLVIVGAGNDSVPLVEMASIIGWETTVLDGRVTHARPERFVSGCRVHVTNPEEALSHVTVDRRTAFVLMTHNQHYDKAMMKALAGKEIGYLGMLGPKKKFVKMVEEMESEGVQLPAEWLALVHAPVGLDIGAESPEEIALSVLSEISAAFTVRPGTPLRNIVAGIHPGELAGMKERKLS